MAKQMDVVIAYSTRKQTPKDWENYFDANIKLIRVNNFTRDINLIKDIKAILEVKKIVKKEKPDIVHLHSSKAGAVGRIAISGKQAQLYYTPHGYAFCKKDESKAKIAFYKMIEKLLGRRKCMTIACSQGEYEASKQVTKKSIYINNGIDIEEIRQYILHESKELVDIKKLKICTVGRIGAQKNPQVFNQIAEKFPDLQFTWIGDGELRNTLKSPNIVVTGWLDRKTTIKQLYQNDVFILPSLWEGLPITLLEAMFLEKICMVSDVIGNKDVIKNEKNGFICKTKDEYCKRIEEIQNGEIDYLKIENYAKEDVVENYNIDKISQQYLKVYCEEDDCY